MKKRTIDGVHFLRLTGNPLTRARSHAQLLQTEITQGPLPILAKKNEWIIRQGPGIVGHPLVQELLVGLYNRLLIPLLNRQLAIPQRQVNEAMAEILQIPVTDMQRACFQPEGLMLLSRISLMKHIHASLTQGLPGCTSGVALADQTDCGHLLVARNLDYPVMGPWESHPLVAFHEPEDSKEIPHVTVSSAGIHTAGLTAMNREGLTLEIHAHFSRQVSLRGQPISFIGDEIVRRAKTLGQAIDLAKKHPRIGTWALVISSARENNAAVLEMSPRTVHVRYPENGLLAHSNYFHHPELHRQEGVISGGFSADLNARYSRMMQILKTHQGKISVPLLASALGDCVDSQTGEERVIGNLIAAVTSVQSVIFDPAAQKLWISTRKESPVGLGDFAEVSVDRFWEENPGSLPLVAGYLPRNPKLPQAARQYRSAFQAWHQQHDRPGHHQTALAELEAATACFPEDGHLWFQTGIVAFFLKQFDKALSHLERAQSLNVSEHIAQVADLYRARCFDLQGQREKALLIYNRFAQTQDASLNRAFRRGVRRPYRVQEIAQMMVDLQFVGPHEH